MIPVARAGGRAPDASWFTLAAAKTATAIAEGAAHLVDDGTYGHAQVRMALEDLFNGKCAYCESKTTATSPWDVEHFRPKKAVSGVPAHTGYFWLAYTWDNLYLSCQFCNQRRRDQPTTDEPTLAPSKGKLDQFPLSDEATRAMLPVDDITLKARLLLDPCADDPAIHLTFGLKGSVEPIAGSEMGTTTIEICNLNRRRLRKQREAHVRLVIELVERWKQSSTLDVVLTNVREVMGASDQPYASVVRAVCAQPTAFGIA